jgi:hypothetical protein
MFARSFLSTRGTSLKEAETFLYEGYGIAPEITEYAERHPMTNDVNRLFILCLSGRDIFD